MEGLLWVVLLESQKKQADTYILELSKKCLKDLWIFHIKIVHKDSNMFLAVREIHLLNIDYLDSNIAVLKWLHMQKNLYGQKKNDSIIFSYLIL